MEPVEPLYGLDPVEPLYGLDPVEPLYGLDPVEPSGSSTGRACRPVGGTRTGPVAGRGPRSGPSFR
ncbi:hypothetical protein CXF35_07595 [Corynebacterium bovis]|nr:hypothetical protein CXF34_07155 [Corynebacterium bovis]RRQ11972.1 hypothetical protein CXF35_07595 [Corynebacterium bovis]